MECAFEQGPIRPPSEARSLLIRATRNCPWNKCLFCHTYRGTKFQLRSVAEVKEDIRRIGEIAEEMRALSRRCGEGGEFTDAVARVVFNGEARYDLSHRTVAAWLYWGGASVFLQDANTLIMKTPDLQEIFTCIRETFPSVKRITSYCRSHTAARKSPDDWKRIREAGLSRVHTGMESGCDAVLQFMKKGVTAEEQIAGGVKIREAGISLCEYYMPGLGGRQWSREHALDSARVINRINPAFVRLRTLHVVPGTDLHAAVQDGSFTPLGDDDILQEIRLFIENLEGIETTIVSDHILNLLEELEGTLPRDRDKLLGMIDRYFSLPEEARLIYRWGRRMGLYRSLDDLDNGRVYGQVRAIVAKYEGKAPDAFEKDLDRAMHGRI